jgi:alpha-1,6-mannosyltransferase
VVRYHRSALQTSDNVYADDNLTVHVHISNLAAQTGASLFLQINSPPYADTDALASSSSFHWIYNKTESLSPSTLASSPQFTHLIVESDADVQFFKKSGKWELVDCVWAFEGWKFPTTEEVKRIGKGMAELDLWNLMPKMETKEKLWIMERTGRAR